MPKVDSDGRIRIPDEVRDRLGLDPGTEVDVREEDGRAIVEPEDTPEEIIADLERRISASASRRDRTPYDELGPQAKNHVETVRRQATDSDGRPTDE